MEWVHGGLGAHADQQIVDGEIFLAQVVDFVGGHKRHPQISVALGYPLKEAFTEGQVDLDHFQVNLPGTEDLQQAQNL